MSVFAKMLTGTSLWHLEKRTDYTVSSWINRSETVLRTIFKQHLYIYINKQTIYRIHTLIGE